MDTGTAKFDLTLSMRERRDEGLSGSLEYSTDLFNATTIERMCEHFRTLLENIVQTPACTISRLKLITDMERRQVIDVWNSNWSDLPSDLSVQAMFERQAAETPRAVALEFNGEHLTYEDLNARANAVAVWLRSEGVGRGVIVGMLFERSIEMYVALLGILKSGGAYLPLSTSDPEDRIAYMVADARPQVLITQEGQARPLPAGPRIIRLPSGYAACAPNPANSTSSRDPGYVMYTSGSTGRPKAVCMPHGPLVNLLRWQSRASTLHDVRTAQFTPLTFDVSFQEIFSTWCRGGSLIGISDDTRRDPAEFLEVLQNERINSLFVPFVALQQLAEASTDASVPKALREVFTAGEQLFITPAIDRFFRALPECELHNHYGPTESHVVTAYTLPADRDRWEYRVPVGRPITNSRVYILDGRDQPVPVGVPGELHIGGEVLADGYLNQDALTADRFPVDPFGRPGDRMYRTGDMARFRVNGTIEFLGRKDYQVKLRGYRIEPGEIEKVLEGHPSIRQAVVVLREDNPGYAMLVAYVLRSEGQQSSGAELQTFLSSQLPDYMVPTSIVALDSFPLTSSGKIDRKALPVPRAEGGSRRFVAPNSSLEEVLSRIWAEVLNLEKVSIDDNFFSLGGHSLLATQVVSRIRTILRVDLPLRRFFEAPTVQRLAQAILADERKPGRTEKIAGIALKVSALSPEEAGQTLEQMRRQEQTQ